MIIKEILQEKHISQYQLSKLCDIPYTTIHDLCTEKTSLQKCSAGTLYKISKVLDVTMEYLLENNNRASFEIFKSEICHKLKELQDIHFVIWVLESQDIRKYYEKKWYPECFYLLAMLDYISRLNHIPQCQDYDDLRNQKLEKTQYPQSVIVLASVNEDTKIKEKAYKESIPEFIKYNIVESDVRNVV